MTLAGQGIYAQAVHRLVDLSAKLGPVRDVPVSTLLTPNRPDIRYRIEFLTEVLDHQIPPHETDYWRFIGHAARRPRADPQEMALSFLNLLQSVEDHGLQVPLLACRFRGHVLRARANVAGTKYWRNVGNTTGLQLREGAHRLAVTAYLGYSTAPTKIVWRAGFEVPDYALFEEICRL